MVRVSYVTETKDLTIIKLPYSLKPCFSGKWFRGELFRSAVALFDTFLQGPKLISSSVIFNTWLPKSK